MHKKPKSKKNEAWQQTSKNVNKWDQVTFSCNFDPQMCHKRGGRRSHIFNVFWALDRFEPPWCQNGAKGYIMTPFCYHFGSHLTQNYTNDGDLEWETTPNIDTKTSECFYKLASDSFCKELWSVLEIWRAFRFVVQHAWIEKLIRHGAR